MSVDRIEKKVLESARADAERLVGKAEAAARQHVESARAENERRTKEAVERAEAELKLRLEQQATSARAGKRLQLLEKKSALLDEIFRRAVEQFVGDRGGAYRTWLAAQLESVAGETGELVPAEPDREAVEQLLGALKQGEGLTLADESLPLRGGFLLRGEKVDIDCSLDARLEELRAELLPQLAGKAFPETT